MCRNGPQTEHGLFPRHGALNCGIRRAIAVKWVFLLGLLVFTPWLAMHLKAQPRHLPYAGFAIGILPFLLSGFNLTASPISWSHWSGAVKGIDISLLDGVASLSSSRQNRLGHQPLSRPRLQFMHSLSPFPRLRDRRALAWRPSFMHGRSPARPSFTSPCPGRQ